MGIRTRRSSPFEKGKWVRYRYKWPICTYSRVRTVSSLLLNFKRQYTSFIIIIAFGTKKRADLDHSALQSPPFLGHLVRQPMGTTLPYTQVMAAGPIHASQQRIQTVFYLMRGSFLSSFTLATFCSVATGKMMATTLAVFKRCSA